MRHSSTQVLAVLCLVLLAPTLHAASAQSIRQKMKDAAKQQACRNAASGYSSLDPFTVPAVWGIERPRADFREAAPNFLPTIGTKNSITGLVMRSSGIRNFRS